MRIQWHFQAKIVTVVISLGIGAWGMVGDFGCRLLKERR
jgi:hypothetical protein